MVFIWGPNNRFDSGSLTGEYLYPLPKSMEDQANVEVEKGEYVTQPGEAPMEAMGQKHADGGTPFPWRKVRRLLPMIPP